jgi:glycosyltransferase involved in cell wall biosynthesis
MQKRSHSQNHTQPHVLYCITKSNFGGAQKYLLDIATAAQKRGYRVSVLAGGADGTAHSALGGLAEKLAAAGIHVERVPHLIRAIHPLHDVRAVWDIYNHIRRKRPDVVHVMSSKAGIVGALAARLAGVPRVVFTAHGLPHEETWRPWHARKLFLFIAWCIHHAAHISIHLTRDACTRSARMPFIGMRRVVQVGNGIKEPAFLARSAAQQALAVPSETNTVRILTIAELTHNKNIEALVRAVPLVRERVDALHLSVIGDGELRADIEQVVQDLGVTSCVTLHGNLPEAARYLRAFDVFVLPSVQEGFGFVLLEAGLAHVPIVASDLPTIREVLENGTYGTLVPPTPEGIATGILKAHTHNTNEHTRAFAQHIRTHYTHARMCERTLATYVT